MSYSGCLIEVERELTGGKIIRGGRGAYSRESLQNVFPFGLDAYSKCALICGLDLVEALPYN